MKPDSMPPRPARQRNALMRQMLVRPRLYLSMVLGGLVFLALATYWPTMSLWLPRALGMM